MFYALDKDGFILSYSDNKDDLTPLNPASVIEDAPGNIFARPKYADGKWTEGATADELRPVDPPATPSGQDQINAQLMGQIATLTSANAALVKQVATLTNAQKG